MAKYEIDTQAKFSKLLPIIGRADELHFTGTGRLRLPDGFACAGVVTDKSAQVTCEGEVSIGDAELRGPVIMQGKSRFDSLKIDGDLLAYGDVEAGESGAEISGSAIISRGRIRCDTSFRVRGALVVEHDPEGNGVLYCDTVQKLPGS